MTGRQKGIWGVERSQSEVPFPVELYPSQNLLWHLELAMDPKGIAQEQHHLMVEASFFSAWSYSAKPLLCPQRLETDLSCTVTFHP